MNLFFVKRNSAMLLYNSSLAHTQLEISHRCTWWCTTPKCCVRLMMITHQLCFFIYLKHMNYGMHIIDRILGGLAINLWMLNVPCLIAKQKSIYIFLTCTTLSDNFLYVQEATMLHHAVWVCCSYVLHMHQRHITYHFCITYQTQTCKLKQKAAFKTA